MKKLYFLVLVILSTFFVSCSNQSNKESNDMKTTNAVIENIMLAPVYVEKKRMKKLRRKNPDNEPIWKVSLLTVKLGKSVIPKLSFKISLAAS